MRCKTEAPGKRHYLQPGSAQLLHNTRRVRRHDGTQHALVAFIQYFLTYRRHLAVPFATRANSVIPRPSTVLATTSLPCCATRAPASPQAYRPAPQRTCIQKIVILGPWPSLGEAWMFTAQHIRQWRRHVEQIPTKIFRMYMSLLKKRLSIAAPEDFLTTGLPEASDSLLGSDFFVGGLYHWLIVSRT
eukprot:363776-Pyramimonas_sp.AAC.1